MTQLKDETALKIQTIEERCTAQIVSLNADFEKDKKRLEGQVETQQATLDKQKKERESQILREWEEAEKEKLMTLNLRRFLQESSQATEGRC